MYLVYVREVAVLSSGHLSLVRHYPRSLAPTHHTLSQVCTKEYKWFVPLPPPFLVRRAAVKVSEAHLFGAHPPSQLASPTPQCFRPGVPPGALPIHSILITDSLVTVTPSPLALSGRSLTRASVA
jgi:hypothetical protein